MALTFFGTTLPGIAERIIEELPEVHECRTHFAGVWGDSVIPLGAGSRGLSCKIWLNDPSFTSAQSLQDFLSGTLDPLVGTAGVLASTDAVPASYADCVFRGWKRVGDVLPVIGAGMPAGTYWCEVELHWTQNMI